MSFKDKKLAKNLLADKLGLQINTSLPLLALNFQYFNYDFEPDLEDILNGLKTLPITIAVKEPHNKELKKHLSDIIIISENNWSEFNDSADMMLFFSDDEHIGSEIIKVMEHSVVPICYRFSKFINSIKDYNPIDESGNSFLFEQFNKWKIFSAANRAIETSKFQWDWQGIIKNGLTNKNLEFSARK